MTNSVESYAADGVHAAQRPPGPSVIEAVRILAGRPVDLFRYLPRIAARYGDVVDLPVPGMTITLLNHPDHVEHVWIKNNDKYPKFAAAQNLTGGQPPALPILDGDEWRRVRRTVNPFFTEKALANVTCGMVDASAAQLERWRAFADANEYVDIEQRIGSVVMSTLLRSMFSFDADDTTVDRWVSAATAYGEFVITLGLMSPLPDWIPRWKNKQGRAAQNEFLGGLDVMIQTRLRSGERENPDVLDVLLGMQFDGSEAEQYARIRSELSALVFAGFDTTAEALAWSIALLCRTPDALGKAYAEVDELGDAPLTYDHVKQLPYLRACFDEAQRLQSAPLNGRTARVDDVIGGYAIPAGSHVVISPLGLQTDARFWKDPTEYRPDRWFTDPINKNAFVPFSTGPRKCMGARMAYISGVLIFAGLLRRYTFEIQDGWSPKHALHLSIGLTGGLPVRIHSR